MDSPRVRLEVAILAADEVAPAAAPPPHDGRCLTVLAVAADADVRRYVQECLRDRSDVRVVTAATVTDAITVAAREAPRVMVVDAPQCEVILALPELATVMIVDDVPRRERPGGTRVRFLSRPFAADALIAEVGRLLDERLIVAQASENQRR